MGVREDKSKRRRETIVRSAVAVFSRKGFHKSSVEDIARRAGVGKGSIYLYFPNKSALFGAAVTEGIEGLIERLRSELVSELPFPRHFKLLVETSVSYYLKYGDLTQIFNNELSNGLDRQTRLRIEEVRNRFLEFFAAILADGHRRGYIRRINFHLAAVGLVGLLDSLCNHQLRNKAALDEGQITDTVYVLLARGLVEDKRRPAEIGRLEERNE